MFSVCRVRINLTQTLRTQDGVISRLGILECPCPIPTGERPCFSRIHRSLLECGRPRGETQESSELSLVYGLLWASSAQSLPTKVAGVGADLWSHPAIHLEPPLQAFPQRKQLDDLTSHEVLLW